MNLRNVLKTYSLLCQLTDDESALLETLRAMTDGEREQLVESLAPAKPVKKPRKPRGKSARATGMAETLNKSLEAQRNAALNDITGESEAPARHEHTLLLCTYVSEDGDDPTECGEPRGSGIHDSIMGYKNYHEFQPPVQAAVGGGGG